MCRSRSLLVARRGNIAQVGVTANSTQLRDRWRGTEGQARATAVVSALATGSPLAGLGLDQVDGRTDVRGLWLVSTKNLPADCVENDSIRTRPGVTWRALDFCHGTLCIDPISATVVDCRFDNVGYRRWRVVNSTLERCTFTGADLRDSGLDGWNGSQQRDVLRHAPSNYTDCTFTRTRIGPYDDFGRATLSRCLFDRTAFPSPMWMSGANLRACSFIGKYRTVCFGWPGPVIEEPAPLVDDVDATQASFESLETYRFRGSGIAVAADQTVYAEQRP
jgi:hypothetical protein